MPDDALIEAVPVAVPEVGAETPPGPSELQQFREKKARAAGVSAVVPAPLVGEPLPIVAAPVAPVVPAPAELPEVPPTLAAEHIIEHEGVKYDRRTRAGKEIVKLKGVLKASETRIAELQAQIARQPVAPVTPREAPAPAPADDSEPQLEAYAEAPDPYAAYISALSRWHARQEYRVSEGKRMAADRVRAQETETTAAQAAWDAKLPEVRQRYPQFDESYNALFDSLAGMARSDDKRQRYLVHRLLTSETGHDLAYFLGTHPEEVQRLYDVPGFDQHVLAIGRLEERVAHARRAPAAPAAPAVPPAAAPIAPVGAGATVTTYDAKTADLAQYRAHKARLGVRG